MRRRQGETVCIGPLEEIQWRLRQRRPGGLIPRTLRTRWRMLSGEIPMAVACGSCAGAIGSEAGGDREALASFVVEVLFIVSGRKEIDGLPMVGEDRLIPLRARAWLDLNERHARGERVDAKDIRKHANDALRLSQLFAPDTRISVAAGIAADLHRFLDGIEIDPSINPKALMLGNSVAATADRIAKAYDLRPRRATGS